MKRADCIDRHRIFSLAPLAVAVLVMPPIGHAQSARFTIIDARNGLTPEVKEAYAEAMGEAAKAPLVKNRIKIIADPRQGADFDPVDIPDHVRHVDVDIDLVMRGGGPVSAPIDLNHLRFERRVPNRVSQKTTIEGR